VYPSAYLKKLTARNGIKSVSGGEVFKGMQPKPSYIVDVQWYAELSHLSAPQNVTANSSEYAGAKR
jgi:hypothetical protein